MIDDLAIGNLHSTTSPFPDPAALRAAIAEDGYVLLRGAISQGAVTEVRSELARQLFDQGVITAPDGDPVWTGKPVEEIDDTPIYRLPSVQALFDGDEMARLYEQVFGGPGTAWHTTSIRYAIPDDASHQTPPHQDGSTHGPNKDFCTFWVPLVDIPRTAGPLAIAPRSHHMRSIPVEDVPIISTVTRGRMQQAISRSVYSRMSWCTTGYRPGDVLVFHAYMPHASLANRSPNVRLSIDGRAQPALTPVAPWNQRDRLQLKDVRVLVHSLAGEQGIGAKHADDLLYQLQRGRPLDHDSIEAWIHQQTVTATPDAVGA